MSSEQRLHVRVPCKVKVAYEFTSWKDQDLSTIHHPIYTETTDIAMAGLGIPQIVPIDHSLEKKLIQGKEKIKMSISLYENKPPLKVFARLVWVDLQKNVKEHSHRGGMAFIDISNDNYNNIKRFVNEHLEKN